VVETVITDRDAPSVAHVIAPKTIEALKEFHSGLFSALPNGRNRLLTVLRTHLASILISR
jgi:hypothetical protein